MAAQVVDHQLPVGRLEVQAAQVQGEGMEADPHLAGGHHGDARYVDESSGDDLGGLGH